MAQKVRMLALAKLPKARAGDEFEATTTEARALVAIGKAQYLTRDMTAGAPFLKPAPAETVAEVQPEPEPEKEEVYATEAALKMAADRGIDIATITGTGKGGRILATDVEAAASL